MDAYELRKGTVSMQKPTQRTALQAIIAFLVTMLIAELCTLGYILFLAPTGNTPSNQAVAEFIIVPSSSTPKPTAEPTPETTPAPTPEPTPVSVELAETEDAGPEYIDKIVFLGDSTSFGLSAYGILPASQVWTDSIGTMCLFNWAVDPIAYYAPGSYETESLTITRLCC